MSATGSGHMSNFASRSGLPTFGNFGSTLLERSNPGLRKSTPDSEALASSDEEVEQSRLRSAQRKTINNRRSSLLGDSNHGDSRQYTHSGSHPYSPSTGSQPNTPGLSQDTWTSISPSLGAWNTASAYPFGPNIWGANSRDPPARLQEVKQDYSGADNRSAFPNPSVQRSMSFSVGQSDYEPTSTFTPTSTSTMDYPPRSLPGLTRRSSRPANMGHDFGGLARVNESDGDPEAPYSAAVVAPPSMSNIPGRNITRTLSSTSTPTNHSLFRSSRSNLNHPDLDISEVAIEDFEDSYDMQRAIREPRQTATARRMTENAMVAPIRQPNNPSTYGSGFASSTRNNTTWSTVPQNQYNSNGPSRRHSFADVPTRRGTPGSSDDPNVLTLAGINNQFVDELSPGVRSDYYFAKNDAAKSRAEEGVARMRAEEAELISMGHSVVPIMPTIQFPENPNRADIDDPELSIYYVINFKCCRSEIYRIKDGVDLQVNEGDLVIVEADRGEDLGCVMHGPMNKHMATKFKLKYTEQHFGWLMMFTAQAHLGSENPINPNAAYATSATTPKVPFNPIKDEKVDLAKKIKRHAAASELVKLQSKEGMEAKAKRDCQTKVNEHGLNMEILDAEYQLDHRKLTFFFFSTEYINFNVLVTDLFKKFKTRIWMYAINPASFQSPLSTLTIRPVQQHPPPGNAMPTKHAAHIFTSSHRYDGYLSAYTGVPANGFNSAFAPPFVSPYTNYLPYVAPINYQPPPPPAAYGATGGYPAPLGRQSVQSDPFSSYQPQYGAGGHPSGQSGRSNVQGNDLSGRFGNLNLR